MTTEVNTINDILSILRADPAIRQQLRVLLLDEELLELPAKVAQLTARVDQLAIQMQDLILQMQELATQVQQLAAAQQATDERLSQFITHQEQFNQEQREFNAQQETFNRDQREFNARQETFNQDQREFNARQETFNQEQREFNARTDQRLERLEAKTDQLDTKVDNLLGDNFEAKMERAIMPRAARYYGLDSTELLQSQFALPNANFERRLTQAVTAAKVTREEADRLREADFILRARRVSDEAEVFCVVEVSHTVDQHDVTRAREWADLLQAAGGEIVYALTIGRVIPESCYPLAESLQVDLVLERRR